MSEWYATEKETEPLGMHLSPSVVVCGADQPPACMACTMTADSPPDLHQSFTYTVEFIRKLKFPLRIVLRPKSYTLSYNQLSPLLLLLR